MRDIIHNLVDIIYPPRCLVCQDYLVTENRATGPFKDDICSSCQKGLTPIGSPVCPICGRPFQEGILEDHICESCLRRRPFFDRAGSPYEYKGTLMGAIHRLKYEGRTRIAKVAGPLLASYIIKYLGDLDGNMVVIPVPLHLKRLRERGFNQALLLARHVSNRLKTKLDVLTLRRVRYTKPQTGLKSKERRKNVRNAFHVTDPKKIKLRDVLLIDDVATTGSTVNECARVLKKAKAGKIYCFTLARTSIKVRGGPL